MLTRLLDASVLIALFDADHVHRSAVRDWFIGFRDRFATCPIVDGALVRWIVRIEGRTGAAAAAHELRKLAADPRHRFWPDNIAYADVAWSDVLGSSQVTDAYLAALARKYAGRVATLDMGMAALHHDVADLIPT